MSLEEHKVPSGVGWVGESGEGQGPEGWDNSLVWLEVSGLYKLFKVRPVKGRCLWQECFACHSIPLSYSERPWFCHYQKQEIAGFL